MKQEQAAGEAFACRRRAESGLAVAKCGGPDKWSMRDGYRHCSYCGSLAPEHVFEAIDAGMKITPTDKSYKIYVDMPDARAGELKITGMRNTPPLPSEIGLWEKVTEANLSDVVAEGWMASNLGSWMMKTPRPAALHDKFYFQHFGDDDIDRFIALLNGKRVNLAEPGYFYVLPFFACAADAPPATH